MEETVEMEIVETYQKWRRQISRFIRNCFFVGIDQESTPGVGTRSFEDVGFGHLLQITKSVLSP